LMPSGREALEPVNTLRGGDNFELKLNVIDLHPLLRRRLRCRFRRPCRLCRCGRLSWVRQIFTESLILAQDERWRRA
jgi:hypothetical protein